MLRRRQLEMFRYREVFYSLFQFEAFFYRADNANRFLRTLTKLFYTVCRNIS